MSERREPGPPASPYSAEDELFLHHPVPLWVYDRLTLRFIAVNEAAIAQYGYSREQFLAMRVVDLRPEVDDQAMRQLLANRGRRKRWRQSGVLKHRCADGRIIHAEITSHDLVFEGRPAVVTAAYDVTDRERAEATAREAERRLHDSENRYRELVESLDDVVFSIDPSGTITYTSQAVEQFGYTPSELVGQPFASFVHPDDRATAMASFADTIAGKRQKRELRVIDKHGQTRSVRSSHSVQVCNGVPVSVIGVVFDLTEQRRTQEQLRTAGRLEAVGRLAGGVAHDFNNLLVAINGFAEMAQAAVAEGTQLHGDISEILKAGNRAAALTAQLLAFSRSQVLRPDCVDLNDIVSAMEPMLRRLIGEDIELQIVCDPNAPHVRIDPGHLEQVVMNLVVNARDAMPEGGVLRIETGRTGFPARELPAELPADQIAVLTVSDTGNGMDEATQAQIFEPFFTTKPIGQGTGLGLAMVYGFVKQSGGAIAVRSAPGEGAAFRIAIPQDHDTRAARLDRQRRVESGSETILVAEDEDTVRALVRRLLSGSGYRVLTADGAEAALRICQEHDGPIDLLLTDVVMPHMSGPALAARAATLRPEMSVLFMSGYTGSDISSRGLDDGTAMLLQKPFSASALSEAVRAAIEVKSVIRVPR